MSEEETRRDTPEEEAASPPEEPEAAEEAPALEPDDLGIELPEEPEEAMQVLLAEIASARSQAESHLDDLRRVAAEFDNFRKRILREQTNQVERASERVVAQLLPVLDSFDLALDHQAGSPPEQKLLDGVERTYRLLMEVLSREGLEVVPAEGHPFDPEVHEAVSAPEDVAGDLTVTEELRRGYRLKGRVLRPALVAVGGPGDQEPEPPEGETDTDE